MVRTESAAGQPWNADWLSVDDAVARILAGVRPLPAEWVHALTAIGRTLAAPVDAPVDHPPWDNSAVDGYAVRAEDILGASSTAPRVLTVVQEIHAGGVPTRAIAPGETAKVMTGAPIPKGADTVVRVEHTAEWRAAAAGRGDPTGTEPWSSRNRLVTFVADTDAGQNVRRRGEAVRAGDRLLDAGTVLGPAEIGVLAMTGTLRIRVHRRPVVAILSNGDELIEPERFHEVRSGGGAIVDSNAHALAAAVMAAGGEPRLLGIARDDEQSIREHLAAAAGADALLTSGGASVGERDLLKKVLDDIGFRLDFWRVRMQPGSPFSFGHLGEMPVFGLPGNPVSALVAFEVLVRPALRKMQGMRSVRTATLPVRLGESIPSDPQRARFLRARLVRDAESDGAVVARLTGPQGSGIPTSLVRADALLILPAGEEPWAAGTVVSAIPLWRDPAAGPDALT